MKKGVGLVSLLVISVLFLSILSISFASAGWFGDFLNKVFGKSSGDVAPIQMSPQINYGSGQVYGSGNYGGSNLIGSDESTQNSKSINPNIFIINNINFSLGTKLENGGYCYNTNNVNTSQAIFSRPIGDSNNPQSCIKAALDAGIKPEQIKYISYATCCSYECYIFNDTIVNVGHDGSYLDSVRQCRPVSFNVINNQTCTDSDGGLNYYVKGVVNYKNNIYTDYCINSGVEEYYCLDNLNVTMWNSCPNGCIDGACYWPGFFMQTDKQNYTHGEIIKLNVYNDLMLKPVNVDLYYSEPNAPDINGQLELKLLAKNWLINKSSTIDVSTDIALQAGSGDYTLLICDAGSDCRGRANSLFVNINIQQPQVCPELINTIKNPKDLIIENTEWKLEYNYSWISDYDKTEYYSANWRMNEDNEYNYVYVGVDKFSNVDLIKQRLNNALENGLCQVSRVYSADENGEETEAYKNVYVCKNIWRIANQNQQVSQGSNWDYQNDIVVYWFNDNLFFEMEFTNNHYYSCSDSESCDRMDNYQHQREQRDLIAAFDNLINNQNQYTSSGYLDWSSRQFVRYFLMSCGSEVPDTEYEGSWYCRFEPVLCPPHGEQKQICTRWNQVTEKDESRETTTSCNPGICSGCMVPKWFGDKWNSKCIPYGFRFEQQNGWSYEIKEYSESGELREGSDRDFILDYIDATTVKIRLGWNNVTYTLSEGDSVELNLEGLNEEEVLGAKMSIEDIQYSSKDSIDNSVRINLVVTVNERVLSKFNAYCDIDGQVKAQKDKEYGNEWASCQNNYECESNICSYGECVDAKAIAESLNGFRGFVVKMLCRVGNPFSDDGYNTCLNEYAA